MSRDEKIERSSWSSSETQFCCSVDHRTLDHGAHASGAPYPCRRDLGRVSPERRAVSQGIGGGGGGASGGGVAGDGIARKGVAHGHVGATRHIRPSRHHRTKGINRQLKAIHFSNGN